MHSLFVFNGFVYGDLVYSGFGHGGFVFAFFMPLGLPLGRLGVVCGSFGCP